MKARKFHLLVGAVLMLFQVSCVTMRNASMPGMVYSRDGRPLQEVCVFVNKVLVTRSDADGRFRIDSLDLELQQDKPWQDVKLPEIRLELEGYRPVAIARGTSIRDLYNQTRGLPVLWCRMSSHRDLMHDAWKLMEQCRWEEARLLLEEALVIAPASKVLRMSLDMLDQSSARSLKDKEENHE